MTMNMDIGELLENWDYEHGKVSARKIRGKDGKEKIQLRLDLGLLQIEMTGRPDGKRPHGYKTLLAYYEHLAQRQGTPVEDQFELDERACELLRNEGVMYYHRYLAEFVLEEYEAVVRDCSRNLRLMDFCNAYAREESDKYILEQYRPYVIMMRTRAGGLLAWKDNRPKAALKAVKTGMEDIREFYEGAGQEDASESPGELVILRALAKEIEGSIPPDPIKKIKQELAVAVQEERYEDAASLRDQLHHMTGANPSGGM